MSDLHRRALVLGLSSAVIGGAASAAEARDITVYKTSWCGCCKGWVAHLRKAGFRAKVVEVEDLAPIRNKHGVPFELSSCHTGVIAGYVVEGHVPPGDVVRLVREKPKALGITVPGMPIGSPGMEAPDGRKEAYQTLLLLDRKGRTKIFARHG